MALGATFLTRLEEALADAAKILERLSIPFVLVGGLAVSVRAEPRFTRDADLALSVTNDEEAEEVVHEFLGHGYRLLALVEQEATDRLATARLLPPGGSEEGIVVDLLFASSGIEPEVVAAGEPLEIFPDLTVPVARTGHLMALKVLAQAGDRPQDFVDFATLSAGADEKERTLCRDSLDLIQQRGFSRDKDLTKKLRGLVAGLDPS